MPSPTACELFRRSAFLVAGRREQALATAKHEGNTIRRSFVDEVALDQRLRELGAAVDNDVAPQACP